MRKSTILLLGGFLVFGFIGVWINAQNPPGGYGAPSNAGGGSGGGAGVNNFGSTTLSATTLAANAGQTLFMDTQDASTANNNCSIAGSPAVITCVNNTFSCPGDTGKIIWAVGNVGGTGNLALADSTITTCTDALHVTASTNTLQTGALTHVRWGHDDTPAWDAVNTAYNNALQNTLPAAAVCLQTPPGLTTVKHGTLLINPTTNYESFGQGSVCYRSFGITTFSPVPDFNWNFFHPSSTNIQFVTTAIGTPALTGGSAGGFVQGIQVDGAGLNTGPGVCAFGGNPQEGMFLGQTSTINVGILNWCAIGGWTPIVMDNFGFHYDLKCINAGGNCAVTQGANTLQPTFIYGAEINSFGTSLTIGTPTVTKGCAIYSPQFAVQLTGSGLWESSNDSVYQTGGFSGIATIKANNTSSATISDCTAQSNGNPVFQTANTAFIHVRGCHINAASTFFWADSHSLPGGPIYDDGANVITGSTSSDAIPTAGHGIWGIGTGTATSSATLFLVGQNAVANAFTNATATTISGIAQFTGTLSELVCTFTTAGLATDSVTVQTAPLSTGTFAATTLTVTNLTTTTVSDHTHTASVTLGQPVQFKFVTNAADTLAGAQCRVSLH